MFHSTYVYQCVHHITHTPGAVFEAPFDRQLHTTKKVPIPNDTTSRLFGKLSAGRVQGRPFWRRHYASSPDIHHRKSAQLGVIYNVHRIPY